MQTRRCIERVAVLLLITVNAVAFGKEEAAPQELTSGITIFSPDRFWKISVSEKEGQFLLVFEHENFQKVVDQSPKPIFYLYWSERSKYLVILRPVGFCTMAKVLALKPEQNLIVDLFASERSNQRPWIDYSFKSWNLKEGFVSLNVHENLSYVEEPRDPRLLAIEYIYLDGKT